jgi:hypothetical protein
MVSICLIWVLGMSHLYPLSVSARLTLPEPPASLLLPDVRFSGRAVFSPCNTTPRFPIDTGNFQPVTIDSFPKSAP